MLTKCYPGQSAYNYIEKKLITYTNAIGEGLVDAEVLASWREMHPAQLIDSINEIRTMLGGKDSPTVKRIEKQFSRRGF